MTRTWRLLWAWARSLITSQELREELRNTWLCDGDRARTSALARWLRRRVRVA